MGSASFSGFFEFFIVFYWCCFFWISSWDWHAILNVFLISVFLSSLYLVVLWTSYTLFSFLAYVRGYNQIHQRTVAIDTSSSFLMQYSEIKLMYLRTMSWLCFLHIDKRIGTSLVLDCYFAKQCIFFPFIWCLDIWFFILLVTSLFICWNISIQASDFDPPLLYGSFYNDRFWFKGIVFHIALYVEMPLNPLTTNTSCWVVVTLFSLRQQSPLRLRSKYVMVGCTLQLWPHWCGGSNNEIVYRLSCFF